MAALDKARARQAKTGSRRTSFRLPAAARFRACDKKAVSVDYNPGGMLLYYEM
jgi:hypothetical protein